MAMDLETAKQILMLCSDYDTDSTGVMRDKMAEILDICLDNMVTKKSGREE
jgi:hypothetical protein